MGIYDRDYYRREGPSFLGTLASTGQVCKWLVVINVIVYLIQLVTLKPHGMFAEHAGLENALGPFTNAMAMKPERVFESFEIWRLLTGAFLHSPGDIWHIIWNMLFLWWFGKDMEDIYGPKEFLAFYLTAGVLSNLFWGVTTLWQAGSGPMPMALGASGAVFAVLVLCATHYPTRTILIMFVLPVPLWLFVVIKVGADLFYFLHGVNIGIAVAAHLGGAGFGFLYRQMDWRLLRGWGTFVSLIRRSNRPRLRIYREEPAVAVGARPSGERLDEQLEAKADAVLEKVARSGLDSLTPEERAILQKASEQYKKKRT